MPEFCSGNEQCVLSWTTPHLLLKCKETLNTINSLVSWRCPCCLWACYHHMGRSICLCGTFWPRSAASVRLYKMFSIIFKNKWKPTVLVVPPLFINSTFLYLKCRFEFLSALYFYFSVCFSKIQDLSYFFFEIKFTSISVSVQFQFPVVTMSAVPHTEVTSFKTCFLISGNYQTKVRNKQTF